MATLQEVEQKFMKADAAGDTPAAKVLAAEIRRLRAEAAQPAQQQQAAAPPDDGQPAVVEPNGNWLHDNHPDVYNAGHEFFTGVAQGVGNLPNAVPNIVNNAQSLYDLHFGSGAGQVAHPMPQWMTGSGFNDQSIEQMNPQTPGYEGTRQYGQMTGAALPAGPVAAVAAPALSTGGGYVGDMIDTLTGDQNHKWQQTLSTALPMILGLTKAPLAAISRRGLAPGVGSTFIASQIDPSLAAAVGGVGTAARIARTTSRGSMASDLAGSLKTQAGTLPYDHRRRD